MSASAPGYALRLVTVTLWLVPASAFARVQCDAARARIEEYLARNFCDSSKDCAAVDLPPPYRCGEEVRRDDVPALKELLQRYQNDCGPMLFNCLVHPREVNCVKGHCLSRGGLERRYPSASRYDENGRNIR